MRTFQQKYIVLIEQNTFWQNSNIQLTENLLYNIVYVRDSF